MSHQFHIGIDFGTTTSAVSWWNPKTNAPEIIRNEHGDEKTPSVVYRGDGEVLIGKSAWEQLHDVGQMDLEMQAAVLGRTFLSVKRLLKANLPLALPGGSTVTPVELTADILAHLKSTAECGCFGGKKVEHVSLSHPVIFNKTEKERLKDAAVLAGFKECRLVEEPLAAIHGYLASGAEAGKNILVFDMGGGTLDLAFLCKDGDGYHMPIPPMGEEAGGDEFDRVLYDHFERKLEQEHGIRFSKNGSCNLGVLAQCRKLKEKLTSTKQGRFTYFDDKANIHASFDLVRDEFEELIGDQVERAVKMAKAMLEKIEAGDLKLDTVLLVGGATRIPVVREKLAEILPLKPLETMHADVAVAMGAALQFVERKPIAQSAITSTSSNHVTKAAIEPVHVSPEFVDYLDRLLPNVSVSDIRADLAAVSHAIAELTRDNKISIAVCRCGYFSRSTPSSPVVLEYYVNMSHTSATLHAELESRYGWSTERKVRALSHWGSLMQYCYNSSKGVHIANLGWFSYSKTAGALLLHPVRINSTAESVVPAQPSRPSVDENISSAVPVSIPLPDPASGGAKSNNDWAIYIFINIIIFVILGILAHIFNW